MKLILSRKGFDSAAGKCPNPILPDGRMVALPIPDKNSIVSYGEIQRDGLSIGLIVEQLTQGRLSAMLPEGIEVHRFGLLRKADNSCGIR